MYRDGHNCLKTDNYKIQQRLHSDGQFDFETAVSFGQVMLTVERDIWNIQSQYVYEIYKWK